MKVWTVSAEELKSAIAQAKDGDTIVVVGGTFKGTLVIEKKLKLIGKGKPVIDGEGKGHVVIIKAPVHIEGFVIRNSGDSPRTEDSGILVEDTKNVVIKGNELEDVLYGIYLKNTESSLIDGNKIRGKDLPLQFRGDGIRLWYSRNITITNNDVELIRDVVIWFSEGVTFTGNRVSQGRYGLHYMYSDHNYFRDNEFTENIVGAFIMYSRHILLEKNVFARARHLTGIGIGLKDATWIVIRHNLIIDNTTGIYLANSPEYTGQTLSSNVSDEDVLSGKAYANVIRNNVLAFNQVAIRFLPPSFPNLITSNTFWANTFIAEFEQVFEDKNFWYANYWDTYRGWDSDRDGYGDIPFEYTSLFLKLLAERPEFKFVYLSPLRVMIEQISKILPFLKPKVVFSDPKPKVEPDFFGWDKKKGAKHRKS